jgi:hypothetical protein
LTDFDLWCGIASTSIDMGEPSDGDRHHGLLRAPGLGQPTVSHQLKKLVQAGLLEREQRGIWAYYSLDRDTLGRLAAAVDLQGAGR